MKEKAPSNNGLCKKYLASYGSWSWYAVRIQHRHRITGWPNVKPPLQDTRYFDFYKTAIYQSCWPLQLPSLSEVLHWGKKVADENTNSTEQRTGLREFAQIVFSLPYKCCLPNCLLSTIRIVCLFSYSKFFTETMHLYTCVSALVTEGRREIQTACR